MLLIHFLHLIEDKVIYKRWLHREIAQKCLEILFLSYNLHSFASDQIREESSKIYFLGFFGATFSNFVSKKQLLTLLEQRFEKLRATYGEP